MPLPRLTPSQVPRWGAIMPGMRSQVLTRLDLAAASPSAFFRSFFCSHSDLFTVPETSENLPASRRLAVHPEQKGFSLGCSRASLPYSHRSPAKGPRRPSPATLLNQYCPHPPSPLPHLPLDHPFATFYVCIQLYFSSKLLHSLGLYSPV